GRARAGDGSGDRSKERGGRWARASGWTRGSAKTLEAAAALRGAVIRSAFARRPRMVRRASAAAVVTTLLVLAFGRAPPSSAPIRFARHPDYHAGRIAFSYLGDIWTAGEDGSSPTRLSDHRGHDMYPRFSPDGKWIAFTSNRYGNNDVFVVPSAGGAPRR